MSICNTLEPDIVQDVLASMLPTAKAGKYKSSHPAYRWLIV